jgi:succinyl-diaminopimelate desuccinylase
MTPGAAAIAGDVLRTVEGQREEIVALCAALVAAPSVNPPGDTREVADLIARALAERGIASTYERCTPTMPSVVAEIDSGRPGPHLVLNVHMDTMPPGDESEWTVPIWELSRERGRLYGLGMGNMKGAVAAMVTAAGLLADDRGDWVGRVTFTAVSDEVVFGDNGAAFLLRERPELLGDGLLCGEGAGFRRLAIAEKGVLWLELRATGPTGHSSAVQPGRSASARIAEAVLRVDALNGLTSTPPAELAELSAGEDSSGVQLSANIGTVSAGSFIGQIATDASAQVDLRLPPGISAEQAEHLVVGAVAHIESLQVQRIKGWDANWTVPGDPLARAWSAASQHVTGSGPQHAIRLPASDASRWRRAGVPALCYGPQPTWSAGVDDYAEEDEVLRCAALYALTAHEFLQDRP